MPTKQVFAAFKPLVEIRGKSYWSFTAKVYLTVMYQIFIIKGGFGHFPWLLQSALVCYEMEIYEWNNGLHSIECTCTNIC